MRTAWLYFWKEWRDNRAVVLGFLAVVPLALGLMRATMPELMVDNNWFATWCCLGSLAVAVLAIACDLVPGEARRGRLDFLRRLPADLGTAYVGKAAFLVFVLATFPLYGWSMGSMFGKAYQPDGFALMLKYGYCLAMWAFVVSCWLPRGALAAPAAVLVLGLLLLPAILVYMALPGMSLVAGADSELRWLVTLGAFPVAWLSFARGRRLGRGIGAAALRGLPAAAVLFVPAWVYAAVEHYDYHHFDAHSERLVMADGYLGTDGRYVFVNAGTAQRLGFDLTYPQPQRGVNRAVVVDLQTGTHRVEGKPGDAFVSIAGQFVPWRCLPLPVVAMRDFRQTLAMSPTKAITRSWLHYFDGRTARTVKSGWSDMRHDEVERLRQTHDIPAGFRFRSPRGLGLSTHSDKGGEHYWDPFRKTMYARRDIAPARYPLIRPGWWLVRHRALYRLYDPATREFADVKGVPLTHVNWLFDDGRVVVCRDGRLAAVDPETGDAKPFGPRARYSWSFGKTPDGRYCAQFHDGQGQQFRFGRIDPETLAVEYALGVDGGSHLDFRVISIESNDTLIGIYKRRQIVRVRFGSDERTVLWPR